MVDIQYVRVLVGVSLDKLKDFNWKKLIPRFRVDWYQYAAAGIEFTWREGPGVGLGLGIIDLWFGWPRGEESLHTKECVH